MNLKSRKFWSYIMAVVIILSLPACANKNANDSETAVGNANGGADSHSVSTDDSGFQKSMNNFTSFYIRGICETDSGYYIQYYNYLYYIDKNTNAVSIVCAKPECEHNDENCNAYIYGWTTLSYYDGKIFYIDNNNDALLYSMDSDGTNRKLVQNLEHDAEAYTGGSLDDAIILDGEIYYTNKGVLYSSKLGEDVKKAEMIYDGGADYTDQWNSYDPSYRLWADDGKIYFMVDIVQNDGTYKDTLFLYDPENEKTERLWAVPDKANVGEWETTGVYVSNWYVLNGYIYYYLSGNDYWRTDLETGSNEKLAETSKKTMYGSAIFSDEYMCLLNDASSSEWEGLDKLYHEGGDTIYLYTLGGKYIKNFSLKSLEETGSVESYELLFCSDGKIYFLADLSTESIVSSTYANVNIDVLLCSIDISTGEISQLYAFDFG